MAESLGSVVLGIDIALGAFETGINRAKQLANNAGNSIVKGLGGQAGTLGGLTAKLDGLQKELQDVEIGTRRFRELRKEIEKTEQALNRAQGRGGAAGILGMVATTVAGFGVGAAATGFLKSSIDAAVELETITKKLSNTLGPKGAAGALSFTRGLSDELGLSFTTLAGSFSSFTAAASAANVPLDQQRELFAAVSKAAQQLGLSNDEINGSLLALQQIASKGSVQMEELRGQLGERLPIAFAAAAKGLGITQQQLIKLIETGRLSSREFFPALAKGLNELTSASAGAPTTAQNFQKLGNAWKDLQTTFGQNLLPGVTQGVETLQAVIEGLGRKGLADRLGFGTGGAGFLGILSNQVIDATVNYQRVQKQLNLTNKEADKLYSNAARNTGIRNLGFASQQDIERVNREFERLAQAYRKANPDQTDAQSRLAAEGEKLRLAAIARADAETKILAPSRERLNDLQATVRLEGLALEAAQQQLAVDKARAEQRKAVNSYDQALQSAGFDRNAPAVIEAAAKLQAAGDSLQIAFITGSEAIRKASEDAAKRYVEAAQQLVNAQLKLSEVRANPQGLNRFLTPQDQQQRLQSAILQLGPALQSALKDARSIFNTQGVGLGFDPFTAIRQTFQDAQTGRYIGQDSLQAISQFINDVNTERNAIRGVNDAQKSVNQINQELATVNGSLRDQVYELVRKNWEVQVNVSGGTAAVYGDAVNRSLS